MTNPIETAVAPLKSVAIARAEKNATEYAAKLIAKLEAAGMNIDVAFPRGNSMRDNHENYLRKTNLHNLVSGLTTYTKSVRMHNEPDIRKHSAKNVAKFVTDAKEAAAVQYDMFVAKLVRKIGDCEEAMLEGNHVWGYSILHVRKAASHEEWKTQQIVNVSKFGLLFNQWPSRKMK